MFECRGFCSTEAEESVLNRNCAAYFGNGILIVLTNVMAPNVRIWFAADAVSHARRMKPDNHVNTLTPELEIKILVHLLCKSGPVSSVSIVWLRAGRSGDRIPVGTRFFAHVRTGPGAHPASCTMGTGSFPGVKAAGAWCWPPTPS
jgi:hypothetical protein